MKVLNWHKKLRQQANAVEAALDSNFLSGEAIAVVLTEKTDDRRIGRHLELQMSDGEARLLIDALKFRVEQLDKKRAKV